MRACIIFILEDLRDFNLASVALRLVLACLCGGILGLNREKRGRAAGIRTYYIVCLGAACAMLLGQYLNMMLNTSWASYITELGVKTDVSRIASKAVSGIGFLGAGAILLTRNNQVQGLTSAASIWACACLGLAIGIGFYEIVLIGFVLIWLSLDLFSAIDFKARERINKARYAVKISDETKLARMLETINNSGASIIDYDYIDNDKSYIDVKIKTQKFFTTADFINTMYMLDCVESVKRI